MKATMFLLMLALAGCSATVSSVPKETLVPVPVLSVTPDQVPPRPDLVTDTQLDAMDDGALVLSLGSDRLKRQVYEGKLEAVLQSCVKQ